MDRILQQIRGVALYYTQNKRIIKHRLLTPADVAELLQISEKTVYKHRKKLGGFNPAGLGVLRFRQEIIYGIMEGQDPKRLVLQYRISEEIICRERIQDKDRSQIRQRRKTESDKKSADKNRHGLFGGG